MSAPRLLGEATAPWPAGHELGTDLIVPVVLEISKEGLVEGATLEASVGEPYDSAALAASRGFRFQPARDAAGARAAKARAVVRFSARKTGLVKSGDVSREGSVRSDPAKPERPGSAGTQQAVPEPRVSEPSITVEAERPPRSPSETVLDQAVLTAAPHKNSSELMLTVPGVFVSQHSGQGKAHQIFLRGFDAVHGQDVEMWAGGAPVNDVSNLHGQGYADAHFLIPELVLRLRSSPGPYDPKQGDFAVAGTLRFELGYDEPGITAKASLGSHGTRRYFLGYRPKQASNQTFGALELYKTDGFGPARAARHASAMAQVQHDLGSGVSGRVLVSAYAGRFQSPGVLRLEDIESGRLDRFATYDDRQGGASARTQMVFELSRSPTLAASPRASSERWSISPFVVFRALDLRSNFTGALQHAEGDSVQQSNRATTFGTTASLSRSLRLLSPYDRAEAGLFMRLDRVQQTQHRISSLTGAVTDDEHAPGIETESNIHNVAGYVDLHLQPFRRLKLRGGLRADGASYSSLDRGSAGPTRSALGAQLSKRGTLDLLLVPGVNVLLSYGEGFRTPQARSSTDAESTRFTRVVSYELGVQLKDGERVQAMLSGYRTELDNDLLFDHATARTQLVPGTLRMGVAAQLSARPATWFLSHTSLTYGTARFDRSGGAYQKGEQVPYVPGLVVRSDIAFRPELGRYRGHAARAHLGAGLSYLGRRPLPYREWGHDVLLVDAGAELSLGPVEVGLQVFNLFDLAHYDGEFVYASRFGDAAALVPLRHVSVGPPRTWMLSLGLTH